MRIDVLLAEKAYVSSRSKAKEFIKSGFVYLNGQVVDRPSLDVSEDALDKIEIIGAYDYVSRGALKLEHAIKHFGIDPSGKICCDIGASTGGFTDCLLRHGALGVVAIDSGEGQLAPRLLQDPRVRSIEKFNARYINKEAVGARCDIVTCDVSFISQTLIIPAAADLLDVGGEYISLIKPQFEVGRNEIGGNGIVRSDKARKSAIKRVSDCFESNSFAIVGIVDSPICGGDGNHEYLIYAKKA